MKPKWKKHEENIAKQLGGNLVKGSGNYWAKPGDILVSDKNLLVEAKFTDKKSYSLTTETLDKIYEEALFSQKIPIMAIKIQDIEIFVIFKDDFKKLILDNL
jgi:hypothetical protein